VLFTTVTFVTCGIRQIFGLQTRLCGELGILSRNYLGQGNKMCKEPRDTLARLDVCRLGMIWSRSFC
jgi:hypothetical protein